MKHLSEKHQLKPNTTFRRILCSQIKLWALFWPNYTSEDCNEPQSVTNTKMLAAQHMGSPAEKLLEAGVRRRSSSSTAATAPEGAPCWQLLAELVSTAPPAEPSPAATSLLNLGV